MRKLIITYLLLLLLCPQTHGQKQKATAQKKSTSTNYDAYPFALPIEARIGYHRMKEPGIFITLKNQGSRLAVESVMALIMVADPIKLEILKSHTHTFKFAAPIKPGGIGESVVTASEGFNIQSSELVLARCKGYKADKDDPSFFMPDVCIEGQDMLIVSIFLIKYTDGSIWTAPERRKNK